MKRHTIVAEEAEESGRSKIAPTEPYNRFRELDGKHDFKTALPGSYVEYSARRLKGGRVFYFNYELAKEMGLIPQNHPSQMNPELEKILIDTFALQILNEYDIHHGPAISTKDILPGRYMATRYLQLQHPNKKGRTSGDGRGIWNGQIQTRGITWDVSSGGTGATCLSPASAIENRFFKTGDPEVSYGCGFADVEEGISTALMSQSLHQSGVLTERTLVILEFAKGRAINVRAAKSLIRPSHLFRLYRLGDQSGLKAAVDLLCARYVANGDWPALAGQTQQDVEAKSIHVANQTAISFGRAAARFESDYLFVWLDWDGDNILANGGILDYGSVRQFGLFHHGYRFDDDGRWSTHLLMQRRKARELVITFAQIRDFIRSGKKKPISNYKNDPSVLAFDREFQNESERLILWKTGFSQRQQVYLLEKHRKAVRRFQTICRRLELIQTEKPMARVSDGKMRESIYNLRTVLRELPRKWLETGTFPNPIELIQLASSSLLTKKDRALARYRHEIGKEFIDAYQDLVQIACRKRGYTERKQVLSMLMRSADLNPEHRMTGYAVMEIATAIFRKRNQLSTDAVWSLVQAISGKNIQTSTTNPTVEKLLKHAFAVIQKHRDEI